MVDIKVSESTAPRVLVYFSLSEVNLRAFFIIHIKLQNDIYTAVELKKKKKTSNMIEFQFHDGNFRGSFQSELHSKQEYTAEMIFTIP